MPQPTKRMSLGSGSKETLILILREVATRKSSSGMTHRLLMNLLSGSLSNTHRSGSTTLVVPFLNLTSIFFYFSLFLLLYIFFIDVFFIFLTNHIPSIIKRPLRIQYTVY